MCNFDYKSVPKGWQHVCAKSTQSVPMDSQDCSRFCSPNGKLFTSLADVQEYNRKLERDKLEKENKKFLAESMRKEIGMSKVTVNNSSMLACNECSQTFYSSSMLKKHQRTQHMFNSFNPVKCNQCSESFPSEAHLKQHVTLTHFSISLPCQVCGRHFPSLEHVEKHVKEVHNKIGSNNQYEPLNLSKKADTGRSFQYPRKEIEERMHEIVSRTERARNESKSVNDLKAASLFPRGISVSGPNLKNSRPNPSNIRLEKNNMSEKEAESRISNMKELSVLKRKKYQPLGPEIEKQLATSSNFQPYKSYSTQSQETQPFFSKPPIAPKPNVSPVAMVEMLKAEFKQLHQPQAREQVGRAAPISGEEMLQAMNNKSFSSHARRRDISFPIRRAQSPLPRGESPRNISRKPVKRVSHKLPPLPSHSRKRPIGKRNVSHNPTIPGKNQITVNMACRFLGLKDYPVPINENNIQFFKNQSNFEAYYLPLVASVNMGANPLSVKTLVKAKWFEVIQSKLGGKSRSIYFNKPRRNKVKVNVPL